MEGSAQSPATKPHPSKTSPSKAIKPQLSKPPAGEVEDSSKVKITPSPAPKPKPKPTVRTKKPPEGTSSFPHSQTCCGNVNRE